MKLKDLPEHMRTKKWIESEIVHEEHQGVHTYHKCECGRDSCRSFMCSQCWKDVLKEAIG